MLDVEAVGSATEKMHHAPDDVVEQIKGDLAPFDIVTIPALGSDGSALLERALDETGDQRVLVVYDPAQWGVARGLAVSQFPSAALETWKTQATSLLSVYRRHRRRVTFAALAGIEADPERFRALLSEHFGLTGSAALVGPERYQNSSAWKAWHVVLARQAVAADPAASLLDGELEAAALPLAVAAGESDAALAQLDEVERERADLETERGLLIRQLSEMQDALLERLRAAEQEQESLTKARREVEAATQFASSLQVRLEQEMLQRPVSTGWDDGYARSESSGYVGDIVATIFQSQGWNILPKKWRRSLQIRILSASGLLDAEWYLQYHPDVAEAKVDPVTHYLIHGAQEGRPPNSNYL